MVQAADYELTLEIVKRNISNRYEKIIIGLEIMEKINFVKLQSVNFELIESLVLKKEFYHSNYEGGSYYIESLELLEVIGNTTFEIVVMGNSSDECRNVFDIYTPEMSETNKILLEEKLNQYLKNGAFPYAEQGFVLRFC